MRTVFIGDIHGCGDELAALLEAVEFRPGKDRLLLVGDAFSRGPDPLRVWDIIRQLDAEMVIGNHDAGLLKRLRRLLTGRAPKSANSEQKFTLENLLPEADALLPWLEALPLWIKEREFLLVHAGINPERGLKKTTRKEFLTIRTWPPTDDVSAPRWHDYYLPQKRLLVFGHDALGGLVVKRRPNGPPYLLGLDSACIYGGRLTAYILEEDRLVQVPSLQC